MQRFVRSGGTAALLLAVLGVLAGCEDECKTGKTECINGELIRTCVPTADDNEWLISACPDNSTCVDKFDSSGADGGTTTTDGGIRGGGSALAIDGVEITGPACIGDCVTGESECVDDSLARFCVAGGVWQLDMCTVGEKCVSGKCIIGAGGGAVQACVPGTKQCASDKIEKICDPDGTSWIQQPCAANETCTDTECVADPGSSCDDGNVCLDAKHATRCLGKDKGFQVVECTGDTYCLGGVCRGSVCALGSVCAGPNQVRTCVDGESFEDTQCGVNQVCEKRPDSDTAACVPLQCVPNNTACGDPRDPSVDTTTFFTTCAADAITGNPVWVKGECAGGTTCDPTVIGGGGAVQSPCRQKCTKGAQRCVGTGTAVASTGIATGTQTCGDDGTWEAAVSCNAGNDTYLQCALKVNRDASALPEAVCAEPVCAAVFGFNNGNVDPLTDLEGYCVGGQLIACNPDGSLATTAVDCAKPGVTCTPGGLGTSADTRTAGFCPKTPVCTDGATRCVLAGGATRTSRFQTCVDGFWSNDLETCPNDGLCFPASSDGTGTVCGAECIPGSHQCDPTDVTGKKIQTCDADGKLGAGTDCALGACGATGTGDASCFVLCIPGETLCTGGFAVAADGFHSGTDSSSVCGSDGLPGTATACAAGTVCRTSSTGEVAGCVECIGTDVPGGNAQGTQDTACVTGDNTQIRNCVADNTFEARACNGTKVCKGGSQCGMCTPGSGGAAVICTNANVNDTQVCLGCDVTLTVGGPTTLTECTQTAIAATANAASVTCTGNAFGTPTTWAGHADCCSGYVSGYTSSCGSEGYGVPVSAGGFPDCCSAFASNTAFAYCAEP